MSKLKPKQNILVEHYGVSEYFPDKLGEVRSRNYDPFTFEHLWNVDSPQLEISSKQHGDLSIKFKDNGEIEILYWSPRIKLNASNVVPATLVLIP